jgi:predicted HTH transcriptional regulator
MRYKIFISSVQKEFAKERRMLSDYLRKDALFGRFFDVFIFEDIPATDRSPEKAYIKEVKQSDIYLGLFGKEFGHALSDGTSPVRKEFEAATTNNKYRLVFLLNVKEGERHPKMDLLIKQVSDDIVYGTFSSDAELLSSVYSGLVSFLVEKGELRMEPFDKSADSKATLSDLSDEKIDWFVNRARAERNFPLAIDSGKDKILAHLNLLNNGRVTNAAILLFGQQPQRFFLTSEIKCAHFHGTRVEKPIPFYQVYKGNLFELVDQAVNFVLSKIDYAVGTRSHSAIAPTAYEIPPEVIEEAIVNAVAHRDYDSTASVQVMLFSDRLEISNPGQLPLQLTINKLKEDHASYPKNPLLAEVLYLAHYIERMGTGIQDIIKRCKEYGLPEPDFKMRDGFVATIYRKKGLAFEKIDEEEQPGDPNDSVTPLITPLVTPPITPPITELEKKLMEVIRQKPTGTRKDFADMLGVSAEVVKEYIEKLKNKGLLQRAGNNRTGYWEINRINDNT